MPAIGEGPQPSYGASLAEHRNSNAFAAQAVAHKKFGHEVSLVLGPLDASSERQREIGDVDIEMHYEGISSVVYGRTSDTMKPYQSRSFLDWILAGRDDSLSIRSRHALVLGGKQAV